VDRQDADGPWDDMIVSDLTRPGACAGLCEGVEAVFHLAAKTHAVGNSPKDEREYRTLNVDLTRELVADAVSSGVARFVMMSSVKTMGEGGYEPLDESSALPPDSTYGHTKLEAENLVLEAGMAHGVHTGILRAPLIYGPGVKGNLRSLILAVKGRRFPPLPDTGNRRSLVDVRDVVQALTLVAFHPEGAGRTFVVTDGHWYSTREMIDAIRGALGRKPLGWAIPAQVLQTAAALGDRLNGWGVPFPFDRTVHGKMLGSACYSSRAIEDDLGFRPEYTLDKSLPEMI